jgi:hypothetical protein
VAIVQDRNGRLHVITCTVFRNLDSSKVRRLLSFVKVAVVCENPSKTFHHLGAEINHAGPRFLKSLEKFNLLCLSCAAVC